MGIQVKQIEERIANLNEKEHRNRLKVTTCQLLALFPPS